MYNDKFHQSEGNMHRIIPKRITGASRPTFAESDIATNMPQLDENIGGRLCDGSLPSQNSESGVRGDNNTGWGLTAYPLAMVYSPIQEFRGLYTPDVALNRGTMFAELDLPFEGGNAKKGGCNLC